ncbi:MAG TPA: DUF6754 domain-containing protein [bacterium]|nr:DUF6754 domain-containing protein [bacterium]
MRRVSVFVGVLAVGLLAFASAEAQALSASPVHALRAHDTPSDAGGSITLTWSAAEDVPVSVLRATSPDGTFETIGEAGPRDRTFVDNRAQDRKAYYYKLATGSGEATAFSPTVGPAASRGNWLHTGRINALVLTVLMFALIVFYIGTAKKGKDLFIRRIAGLAAMDEAIGRATEMGKKMLYIPGIMSISDIQTIASLAILQHVAKQSAVYGADLEVPNKDPLTFSAARETVKQAYLEAGKPDQYKEEMVTYLTYDQFAYAASVSGKMVREMPATNFLIGSFFAESLIFAETGQSVGAIQIAGTADVAQLPFFVTTCDYTLMGEELFAASAYLSREPILLGSIKAQDLTKLIIMVFVAAGIVFLNVGFPILRNMLIAR